MGGKATVSAVRSLEPNAFTRFLLTIIDLLEFRSLTGHSPYCGMMARTPAHSTARVRSTRTTRRRRTPRYACLVRRTGRIAGWREWRRKRARANNYSQEERVTSQQRP